MDKPGWPDFTISRRSRSRRRLSKIVSSCCRSDLIGKFTLLSLPPLPCSRAASTLQHGETTRRPDTQPNDSVCNFLEGSSSWNRDMKLIYRHYATLYFVFAVDSSESELGVLDLIQVFVEALDKCFENVCELDLIFYADKVNYILDEIVMGGMVLETSLKQILKGVNGNLQAKKATRSKAKKKKHVLKGRS